MKWLKTMPMSQLKVLEVRRPEQVALGWKQGVGRTGFLSEAPGDNLPHPHLFQPQKAARSIVCFFISKGSDSGLSPAYVGLL